jgi:hypothetical protein
MQIISSPSGLYLSVVFYGINEKTGNPVHSGSCIVSIPYQKADMIDLTDVLRETFPPEQYRKLVVRRFFVDEGKIINVSDPVRFESVNGKDGPTRWKETANSRN